MQLNAASLLLGRFKNEILFGVRLECGGLDEGTRQVFKGSGLIRPR